MTAQLARADLPAARVHFAIPTVRPRPFPVLVPEPVAIEPERRMAGVRLDFKRLAVVREGEELLFSTRSRFRMVSGLLLRPALTTDELTDIVWGDRPDGGPLHAREILRLWKLTLQAPLRMLDIGIEVRGYWRARDLRCETLIPFGRGRANR